MGWPWEKNNDEIYQEGYDRARAGDGITDFVNSPGPGILDSIFDLKQTESEKIFDKGYEKGRDDRLEYGRREDSDSDDSSSEESSKSCCYIVTACLNNLGLSLEESQELKAMKLVTREYALTSARGKRDYIIYQRNAPGIVGRIESRDDSKEVWGRVYDRLKDISQIVFSGNLERGYKDYKSLVNELSGRPIF